MKRLHEWAVYTVLALIWPRRSFKNYLGLRRSGYPVSIALKSAAAFAFETKIPVDGDEQFTFEMERMWGDDDENLLDDD